MSALPMTTPQEAIPSRLYDLIALANEPSSIKRRELLRGVTDLFFQGDNHNPVEMGLFDDVIAAWIDKESFRFVEFEKPLVHLPGC